MKIIFITLTFFCLTIFQLCAQQMPADSLTKQTFSDSLRSQAQEIELLKKEILNLNKDLTKTEFNLSYHHTQYRTGTIVKATGVLLIVASLFLLTDKSNPETGPLAMSLVGATCFVAGEILCIDSDKYLGRAGRRFNRRK